MKEQALDLARGISDPGQAINRMREYLQALVLRSLHECEAFRQLAFVGGTALRFLHGLPRFSEDLDFTLVSKDGYAGREWMDRVKRDLVFGGFKPQVAWNERKAVHAGWIRLPGILHEAGLAAIPEEKLAVRIEIDTCPPAGGRCERRIVTKHVTFLLQYYDLPSLLAGKIHAVICRRYTKGRDWYDLTWYLSQQPRVTPNLSLLQNALDQTEGAGRHESREWHSLLRKKLDACDIGALARDVRPFLENKREAELLTRENLLDLLKGWPLNKDISG